MTHYSLIPACLIILVTAGSLKAQERVIPLPELIRAHRMAVTGDRLYVLQKNSRIVVFSLSGGRKIMQFGRPGAGPGEFPMLPGNIRIAGDRVFVGNEHQCCFFSLEGKFISQHRPPRTGVLQPLGDGFFFNTIIFPKGKAEVVSRLLLLGPDMKTRKILDERIQSNRKGGFIMTHTDGQQIKFLSQGPVNLSLPGDFWLGCDGIGLLLAKPEGDAIRITRFDKLGQEQGRFELDLPKVPVDQTIRKRLLAEQKLLYKDYSAQYPNWEREFDKLEFSYPEFLPPIRTLGLRNDRIYILTYAEFEGKTEMLVVDLQGKMLKRTTVTLGERWLTDIDSGNYYRLEENHELDQWELHVQPI